MNIGTNTRSYETERLLLRPLTAGDASALAGYLRRNRSFLQEWEPERDESYFAEEVVLGRILLEQDSMLAGRSLNLYLFRKDDGTLIGNVNLSNIVYGAFLSCFAGYKLDFEEAGRGYMTEAFGRITAIAFGELGLHRIEANIMPRNRASIRVAEKLGFVNEGRSRKYLRINGVWEDHDHYVLLNEDLE